MNTDTLRLLVDIELLKREFHQCRLSERADLLSWIQFIVIFCECHQLAYLEVTGDDSVLELLNVLWLRLIRTPRP